MLRLFFILFLLMRYLPEYFDSNSLYWVIDSIIMISLAVYVFKNSEKNMLNLFIGFGLLNLLGYDYFNNINMLFFNKTNINLFDIFTLISLSIIMYFAIFRNRYKWEKMKSDNYNRNKIQAIYSKPDELLTLFGAATSLSPKCSVRYTYNDKTIRFKRGTKTPILCETVLKKTDIIKTTDINPDLFLSRFEEIKDKKYNLLTFNCRRLF
ncbi:MAG: hypothetical protein MJH09_11820 [Cetobacterium sp.]|nr:hypothetical protein [Cetobacterium sp.]NQY43943.1 hypothetical protein [Legionellales bacterium]